METTISPEATKKQKLIDQKKAVYTAIRTLDSDFQMGKLSKDDHRTLRNQLVQEAVPILKQLEELDGTASDPILPVADNNIEVIEVQLKPKSLKANKKIADENLCKICNGKFNLAEDIKQCEKCSSFFHSKCWEEYEGCNQPGCARDTKTCPNPECRKQIKKAALKCKYCGQYVDESIKEKIIPFGGNEELKNYVQNAEGISRTRLNVYAAIGVFIFGWLILIVFSRLGKKDLGWKYFGPFLVSFAISKAVPVVGLLVLTVYIAAWVHANMILSEYQSSARQRISEIQNLTDIHTISERELLQKKVLGEE